MFSSYQADSGVFHITDAMGVSCTLIEGKESALLFDAGYGTENVADYVRTLTRKPVTLLLSHGHHDHVLGARWFSDSYLCQDDMEEFLLRTGPAQRREVAKQAAEKGVQVPDDYLTAEIGLPKPLCFTGKAGEFLSRTEMAGDRPVQVIRVPGHTAGSIVLYLPEERLLLTGDNWNPCTWLWFPGSVPAGLWREHMEQLVCYLESRYGGGISRILCSHQPAPRQGSELKAFLQYMTDDRLADAPWTDMRSPVNTHAVVNEQDTWTLLFDYDRFTAYRDQKNAGC